VNQVRAPNDSIEANGVVVVALIAAVAVIDVVAVIVVVDIVVVVVLIIVAVLADAVAAGSLLFDGTGLWELVEEAFTR
jgi:hypothetical protein